MNLIELSPDQLSDLYQRELVHTFPPDELKPLKSMLTLMEQNRYDALGLEQDGELLGYALMWRLPGVPFALLDYLGTIEGKRGNGLGSSLLDRLTDYYRDYRGIFGEAEGVFSSDPEEAALQARRLGFYDRNGFRYGGYDCALFGVHYRTLFRGAEDVTPEELLSAHQRIYRSGIPSPAYERFIQIPLHDGEAVRPSADWIEE